MLREARLADLLADQPHRDPVVAVPRRLEASGVAFADGRLWVVFDNLPLVASLDPRLPSPDPAARLIPVGPDLRDVEDLAHDDDTGDWYLVVEGRHTGSGPPKPLVAQHDRAWKPLARKRVDLALDRPNKGVEGLACVRRADRLHLLALSEGPLGLGGKARRRHGGGRVYVLAEDDTCWRVEKTFGLPTSVRFEDCSAISVAGDRVAVVSQESSALWVGRLAATGWGIMGDGVTYPFPREGSGDPLYRAIEGVAWLDEQTLAVVSDRVSGGKGAAREKDESVHIVALPSAVA